jgi:arginase
VRIHVISVPFDSGVKNVRMGRGPGHLLDGGLRSHLESQGHTVTVREIELPAVATMTPEPRVMVELNKLVAAEVGRAGENAAFPVVLAGSCYTAIGTLTGLGPDPVGVFWFDSHGDCNTPETTGSGFLDGMAVATLTGRCWDRLVEDLEGFRPTADHQMCLVGVRDLDDAERALIEGSDIHACPPASLSTSLMSAIESMEWSAEGAYLHFDLDVLDPSVGRANALAAPDGLTVEQSTAAIAAIGNGLPIRAAALTAYDPAFDTTGTVQQAAFTVLDAILAGSALGRAQSH